nr:MAG TPA: hypothetical protein [Caudoviricetes sp.]
MSRTQVIVAVSLSPTCVFRNVFYINWLTYDEHS